VRGLSTEDIKTVDLRVNPEVLTLTGKTDPQTGLEGKFSIYHATAVGLLFGEATPSQFTDAVVKNATVVEMRKKVNVTVDKTVAKAEAYINLTFNGGTTLEKHVEHAKGSIENPLTDADLEKKFMEQVGLAIGDERAKNAFMAFTSVQSMEDVALIRQMY
jgi:aconitate decarboxylase